jgi:predicted nucleic acid-binding protein
VIVPEIADYEVRRELIRRNSQRALANLDQLCTQLEYLPITTRGMRLAANLWAQARNAGLPTAAGHALDGDVVLAAQANSLNVPVYRRDGQSGTLVAISSCGFVVECQGVRTAIANSTPCQTSLLSASSPGWCAGRLLAYPVFVA